MDGIADMGSLGFIGLGLVKMLKYLYLIFDNLQRVSLDEWVFNMECYPLRHIVEIL
jgi:hypothetical protein